MNNSDLLHKYLRDSLTDEEVGVFNELMSKDPEFAEQVEVAAVVRADANASAKLHWKGLLADKNGDKAPEDNVLPLKPPKRFPYYLSMVAIGLILLISSFAIYHATKAPSIQTLTDIQIEDQRELSTLMGDNAIEALWDQARMDYKEGRFEAAAQNIEKIIQTGETLDGHHLYLGLCYMYQSKPNYSKAITALEKELDGFRFKEASQWYLSLAYIKTKQYDKARSQLDPFLLKKGNWKKKEAQQLLNQIP